MLAIAITMAILIFFIATAVLNFTYGRFNLSFQQLDHTAAFYASEGGVRYAFTRLALDTAYQDVNFQAEPPATRPPPGFANAVRHAATLAAPRAYVVSSLPRNSAGYNNGAGAPAAIPVDLQDTSLLVGNRNVTIWVQAGINGAGNPEFRVRVFTDYGLT